MSSSGYHCHFSEPLIYEYHWDVIGLWGKMSLDKKAFWLLNLLKLWVYLHHSVVLHSYRVFHKHNIIIETDCTVWNNAALSSFVLYSLYSYNILYPGHSRAPCQFSNTCIDICMPQPAKCPAPKLEPIVRKSRWQKVWPGADPTRASFPNSQFFA